MQERQAITGMRYMSRLSGFALCLICCALLGGSAGAYEDTRITAYYPSPTGNYQELRADNVAIGSAYRANLIPDGFLAVSQRISVGIGADSPLSSLDVKNPGSTTFPAAVFLDSTNDGGIQMGGYNTNGSIQAVLGASAAPLLLNNMYGGRVRIGQPVSGSISDAVNYQLELQCTDLATCFGGRFNGANDGQVMLVWCPGGGFGQPCPTQGYHIYGAYTP